MERSGIRTTEQWFRERHGMKRCMDKLCERAKECIHKEKIGEAYPCYSCLYIMQNTGKKKIDINVFISVLVLQQRKKNVIHDHGIKGTFVYTLIEHE